MLQLSNHDHFLVIKPTWARALSWAGIILFAFFSVMSWQAGDRKTAFLFLIFVAFNVFTLCSLGTIAMNEDLILYKNAWATYGLRWDEVERIALDTAWQAMAFIGKDKRLVVVGPRYWAGKSEEVEEIFRLIDWKIRERQILLDRTQRVVFMWSKNVKVH